MFFKRIDKTIFLSALAIFLIGVSAIYSASGQRYDSFAQRQLLWMGISLIIGYGIMKSDYRELVGWAYVAYVIGVVLLVFVQVLGIVRLGAQRWIRIGIFTLQPSEPMKLIMVLALANYIANNPDKMRTLWGLVSAGFLIGLPFVLILTQPDLGTALVLMPIFLSMLYVGRMKGTYLTGILAGILSAAPFFWLFLKEYQRQRLLVFLDPGIDPLGAGYTITQSKIAIGSGWVLGKGWLSGTQNQLNFLPERHTDFIFSVVGEEWGFVGCAVVLFLYLVLIQRAFAIGVQARDQSAQLLAVGIGTMLSFQVLINIAMTAGFMPVVGIPLPLMTYGGSSLLTTVISLAILNNIATKTTIF